MLLPLTFGLRCVGATGRAPKRLADFFPLACPRFLDVTWVGALPQDPQLDMAETRRHERVAAGVFKDFVGVMRLERVEPHQCHRIGVGFRFHEHFPGCPVPDG